MSFSEECHHRKRKQFRKLEIKGTAEMKLRAEIQGAPNESPMPTVSHRFYTHPSIALNVRLFLPPDRLFLSQTDQ